MGADAVRIHWVGPVSDDDLLELNLRNRSLSFERSADGDIIVTPPAGSNSSRRNGVLTLELGVWNRREGKGVVFDSSAGFRLPDTSVYGPDAAWVQKWKWDALTEDQQERFAPLCPDVVFEIISRTDNRREVRERIDAFHKNGAAIVVLIDPYRRSIEINGARREWETVELRFPGCETAFVLDPNDLE